MQPEPPIKVTVGGQPAIVALGDGRYVAPSGDEYPVADVDDNLFEAFLELAPGLDGASRSMTSAQLLGAAGGSDPARALRSLTSKEKYNGHFAPAIRPAGTKGKGYTVRIVTRAEYERLSQAQP